MKNTFILAALLVGMSGFALNTLADDSEDDSEDGSGKVEVCHKGEKTLRVGTPGLTGHLGHGDTEGSCDDDEEPGEPGGSDKDALVVMMNCGVEGEMFMVKAYSTSVDFSVQPLIGIGPGSDCAQALADLLNADLRIRSVTGDTNYLLLGDES